MADDDDVAEGERFLELEMPGPDGRPYKVRGALVDGPNSCPFCGEDYCVFEAPDGTGFVAHAGDPCPGFSAMPALDFLRRAQEVEAGVNVGGRGSA